MKKEYMAPELVLAGEAEQVVLGGCIPGSDFDGNDLWCNSPYAADHEGVSD